MSVAGRFGLSTYGLPSDSDVLILSGGRLDRVSYIVVLAHVQPGAHPAYLYCRP